jgi:hypothetical protein
MALRIAPFEVDLSPPAGEPIAYGLNRKTDSRIHLRGVVIDDGRTRAVLAAAEIIGLYGAVHARWRSVLARAAGTTARRVLLHCVHQHDSLRPPSVFVNKMLATRPDLPPSSAAFYAGLLKKIYFAVRRAVRTGWRRVESLATAERRLSGLASNRRLLDKHGKVFAMRWSMTSNPKLQRHPVGRIDPVLRTIGFLGPHGRVLATLHYYATHPMGAYGREMASADIPGVALDHLRREMRGEGHHVYFTGCAGDITFGKYTSASKKKNLRVLGRRLGEALAANVRALKPCSSGALVFAYERFKMPLDAKRIHRASMLAEIKKAEKRYEIETPAVWLEALRGWRHWGRPEIARLSLGPDVHVLALPAETVVEYQLYAQALVPERFLAVAAYTDGTHGYIPTAAMYREGGYEPQASLTTPAVEGHYKAALERLLAKLR